MASRGVWISVSLETSDAGRLAMSVLPIIYIYIYVKSLFQSFAYFLTEFLAHH